MPLAACSNQQARPSAALYEAPAWPKPVNLQMQSGVAKYITRGHAAYQACVVNLETLKKMSMPDE
jgi:hypothetical protein|nr:MAG TPA: hypothetical protein [Caudoviricetes sp.]